MHTIIAPRSRHLLPLTCALALCSWGDLGCASDAHRATMRKLEDTRIELAQVESRVILSEEQARRLRASVQTLEREKRALADQNKALANKTLTSNQADDLQAQARIRARRASTELSLREALQAHLQDKRVTLTSTQGHPTLTFAADAMFAPNKLTVSAAHPSLLADVARAVSASPGSHVLLHCEVASGAHIKRCARRLAVIAARVRELNPGATIYPATTLRPPEKVDRPRTSSSTSSAKPSSAQDPSKEAPSQTSTIEVVLWMDLSATAAS